MLYDPAFGFFREFMEEFGAKIPPRKKGNAEPKSKPEAKTTTEEVPMEEDPPIPYPSDIDNSGVIEPDDNSTPLPMGDPEKELTDEDLEKANEIRDKAAAALSEGNFDDALSYFTEAIQLNPGSAMLHAKRASVLLKLKRPMAAITDCDKAISINADSAQAYKFRGRAYRLLGKWVEAHTDLAMACKLDYDDLANEWLKEVEPNAKKIQEYHRSVARQAEEREIRERRERVRRAQEANRRAQEESKKFGDDEFVSGMPGVDDPTGGLGAMLNDPDFAEVMKDPEIMTAFLDIMKNPQNLVKYMGNQKIMKLMTKIQEMKGAGMGSGTGGCSRGGAKCGDAGCGKGECGAKSTPSAPPKAPEPDLD